jgi:hypothetical protein
MLAHVAISATWEVEMRRRTVKRQAQAGEKKVRPHLNKIKSWV